MRSDTLTALFLPCLLGLTVASCADGVVVEDATASTFAARQASAGAGQAPFGYVSAEFMSVPEVEGALPMLAAHQVNLALAWPLSETADERAERFELVRRAAAMGVTIRPWLLLSEADGYWPGASNAKTFDVATRAFVEEWLTAGLAPGMVLIDMEMTLVRTREYIKLVRAQDVGGLISFLRAGVDKALYADATRTYKELVDFLHERGFQAEISTLSSVLDDYNDGDDGVRQALNIPVDGIDWDLYSFQVYRTLAELGIGTRPTTYYVQDYAKRARARFGARAGVILGLTDAGDIEADAPVYDTPGEALRDVQTALQAGVRREFVGFYQLRGLVRRTPSEAWFASGTRAPTLLLPDTTSLLLRASATILDSAL